jgi:RecB family exonuclease
MELSFSLIKVYSTCPYKYKLIHEDGWRSGPTANSSLGHSIHAALEEYHGKKLTSFDELVECYNSGWVNEGFLDAQITQEYYDKGLALLKNYFESFQKNKSEILHVEYPFNVNMGNHTFRGEIDRIDRHSDGKIEIIEYKTHAKLWDKRTIEHDLQVPMYACALKKAEGLTADVLSYYFLAHNVKIEKEARLKDEFIESIIYETAVSIEQKKFEPNIKACGYCEFKNKCPKAGVRDKV